ncbi:SusC/RagA family TonB-linked outer membrane protein [Marinifilum sp. N1E240]|uniref:SusC/RagA family TonB-linked outer membrane protein n=1 Tax=Marinifilum sp. N1E240 TaxID=2608082 RepID=UPI00128C499E|nr:TonB-dependent receptor [Marinifilum sp. N1E240]MPQ47323.1 SusC/RagA family TonB-linked outer membrane protein [Marinifilum sp. N1E240]
MKRLIFIVCAFIMSIQLINAQTKQVTGTVTGSDDGLGLPGVSVIIKGTTTGSSTNIDGKYAIDAKSTDILVFSFVGMQSQEVLVGDQNVIDIVLSALSVGMDEVVVVAYGSQRKRDLTGSVAGIKSEQLENVPIPSFENALQGQTAGVQINTSSRTGEANSVRIRGTSSIGASSQPLYVIDGVPQGDYIIGYTGNNTQQSPLANINPNDIESIQVLKDAASSSLYGARASNGVILITTKRGKAGKTQIDFSYYGGILKETNTFDVLNGTQFAELWNESNFNAGDSDPQILGSPEEQINTNWWDAVSRTGSIHEWSLSARGGNEKTQFYTGFSYRQEEGYTIGDEFDRLSTRVNVDHKFSEKLKFGSNIGFSRVVNQRISNNNSVSSPSTSAFLNYPNVPIYGDGSELYGPEGTFYDGRGVNVFNNIAYNLVKEDEENSHEAITIRPFINLFAEYEIIPDLVFRSEWGLDYIDVSEKVFWGVNSGDGGGSGGIGQALSYRRTNWIQTQTLRYSKTFNEVHNFSALLGFSYQETRSENSNVTGEGFPNNDLSSLDNAANITNGGSSISDVALDGYFSRINYNYDNKYFAEFSLRRDGSSRFGENDKYAYFPAGSLAWVVSDEDFLSENEWLTFLKVRTSYGLTGNSEVLSDATSEATGANFPSRGLYIGGSDYAGQPGLAPSQLANPDLKWEQTAQFNVGLNIGLFNNRVELEADYYIKKTKDLLLNVILPSVSGYEDYFDNIGKLENKGFEFNLNTRNFVKDFKWNTNFNIAFNRNKITNLDGQIITNGISRAIEGEPIGVFFTVKYAGVDPDNGNALYYDLDGNKTSTYSDEFRQIVGDPNPDFTGGLTNTFSYKGVDLSVLLQFVYGNDIYRDAGRFVSNNANSIWNQSVDQLNRWQKPGDITDVPRAELFSGNGSGRSSRWIEDGSYLRVKNITLGYTLPKTIVERLHLRNVRIFAQAQNWFTFDDYSGHDPEVSSEGTVNIGQGQDFFQAPPSKTLTFGVNIGL